MASGAAGAGIVVGVDGSAASRVAVHWAAREAERRELPLTVVHAASTRLTPLMARWIVLGQHELPHERLQRIIDDAVNVAVDSIRRGRALPVSTKVVFTDPVDILTELSRKAHLVVVGSRSRRGLRRILFGSVGSALTPRSHCQVAIVHDKDVRMLHPAHAPIRVSLTGW